MSLVCRTLLAAAAAALIAAPAFAAPASKVNPDLASAARINGRVEALIVLTDQATPTMAPLSADADYKQRRRVLVQALRTRVDQQQQALRIWPEVSRVYVGKVMQLLRQTAQRRGIANTSMQPNQACNRWIAANWPNPMIRWAGSAKGCD